jgi:hypothetical protein
VGDSVGGVSVPLSALSRRSMEMSVDFEGTRAEMVAHPHTREIYLGE